jgi:hypothetical protein
MLFRVIACAAALLILTLAATWAVAIPQPNRESYQRHDSLPREVQLAQDALLYWLADNPHHARWREYLRCDELQQQVELGPQADRRILRQILRRYDSDGDGLEDRHFVAVRLLLRNWTSALAFPGRERLPELARTSADAFSPVGADELASAKEDVQKALADLLPSLGNDAGAGAWREALRLDMVRRQLEGDGAPDLPLLSDVAQRLAGTSALAHREFAAFDRALGQYLAKLRVALDPDAKHNYRWHLEQLATGLQAFEHRSNASALYQVAVSLDWFESRGHAEELSQLVRCHYNAQLTAAAAPSGEVLWFTDYAKARQAAYDQQKLLLIFFHNPGQDAAATALEADLVSEITASHRHRYVLARLGVDYRVSVDGRRVPLIEHGAFAEMRGRQGLAIIDFENPGTKHYGLVVSQFPAAAGQPFPREALGVILDLPPGTLTQRTMIYAVRMHPDAPRSAIGLPNHLLLREAESHSTHQASITSQGHHDWETRFHRINAKLGGLGSREVVAESWRGESLVQAAVECVRCWRSSEGHWDAVSSPHAEYGYDIQLGSNGIWYATGLFGG